MTGWDCFVFQITFLQTLFSTETCLFYNVSRKIFPPPKNPKFRSIPFVGSRPNQDEDEISSTNCVESSAFIKLFFFSQLDEYSIERKKNFWHGLLFSHSTQLVEMIVSAFINFIMQRKIDRCQGFSYIFGTSFFFLSLWMTTDRRGNSVTYILTAVTLESTTTMMMTSSRNGGSGGGMER